MPLPFLQPALHLAANGVHHTGKFGQDAAPPGGDDASLMLLNMSGYHFQVGLQGADGPFLILPHEAAVALDIGAQDGGEFAFYFFRGHGILYWRGRFNQEKKPHFSF
jgi:hypothetical protein